MTSSLLNISMAETVQYVGSYNASNGIPNAMTTVTSYPGGVTPSSLNAKVLALLKEGVSLPTSSPLLTNDLGANIFLKADANVKISFIYDGAGYQNGVGYFNFNTSDLNALSVSKFLSNKIAFPYFRNGNLTAGKTVDLGTMKAGTAIGVEVVANGWSNGVVTKTASNTFRTIQALNPDGLAHTVLLSDATAQMLVIGIEDLNGGGDRDFNDAVVAVQVTPWSSVELSNTTSITGERPKLTGVAGPTNWREISAPATVVDPIKAAGQEIMKAKNNHP